MNTPSSSFTAKSTAGILNVLASQCRIAETTDPPATTAAAFEAIWDTGATNSAITQQVIDACKLRPVGMVEVHGVHGAEPCEVFLVDIHLPNGVGVRQVRVTKGKIRGADVLIGMDIITLGDFAVTNLNGRTVFTFCVPSHRCLDFVDEHNRRFPQSRPGFRNYKPPKLARDNKPKRPR